MNMVQLSCHNALWFQVTSRGVRLLWRKAIFVRSLQLQHYLGSVIASEPFIGNGRADGLVLRQKQFCFVHFRPFRVGVFSDGYKLRKIRARLLLIAGKFGCLGRTISTTKAIGHLEK